MRNIEWKPWENLYHRTAARNRFPPRSRWLSIRARVRLLPETLPSSALTCQTCAGQSHDGKCFSDGQMFCFVLFGDGIDVAVRVDGAKASKWALLRFYWHDFHRDCYMKCLSAGVIKFRNGFLVKYCWSWWATMIVQRFARAGKLEVFTRWLLDGREKVLNILRQNAKILISIQSFSMVISTLNMRWIISRVSFNSNHHWALPNVAGCSLR